MTKTKKTKKGCPTEVGKGREGCSVTWSGSCFVAASISVDDATSSCSYEHKHDDHAAHDTHCNELVCVRNRNPSTWFTADVTTDTNIERHNLAMTGDMTDTVAQSLVVKVIIAIAIFRESMLSRVF